MPLLGDRRHGENQNAVNAILHDDFDVARFDVDVACAALKGCEDQSIDQTNDGTDRGFPRERISGDRLIGVVFIADDLQRKGFRGLFEYALRLFGALQQITDLAGCGNFQDKFLAQQQRQLVRKEHQARIRHGDAQLIFMRFQGHKVETEHQVGRDAPEQLRVNPLFFEIHERAAVAFRQLISAFALTLQIGQNVCAQVVVHRAHRVLTRASALKSSDGNRKDRKIE